MNEMGMSEVLRRQAEKKHVAKIENVIAKINTPQKTLRDEFAMAALTGICSNPEWFNQDDHCLAINAFDLANAMMAQRLVSLDKQDEANPE